MNYILTAIFFIFFQSSIFAADNCLNTSKRFLNRPSKKILGDIKAQGESIQLLDELQYSLGNEKKDNARYEVLQKMLALTDDKDSVRLKMAVLKQWFGRNAIEEGNLNKGKKFLEESIEIFYSLPTELIKGPGVAIKVAKALRGLGRTEEALHFFRMGAEIDQTISHTGRYELVYAILDYIDQLTKKSVFDVDHLVSEVNSQKQFIESHLPGSTKGRIKLIRVSERIDKTYSKIDAAKKLSLTLSRPDILNFKEQEWLDLAEIYQILEMKKEAIAVYDILLQKNPYSSEAQRLKAVVLLKDSSDPEDRKAGELMLRTSNRSDPNNPMTYIDLFNLYMKDNQPELAVSVVEEAFSTLGKTPTLLLPFAKGFFSYALIKSKELGQSSNHWMQESFQLLEQYFEINGYDIEALQLATRVTSNLFKIEKTILYGKLYLDLGGKSYFALQNLGSALRQVGDFAESIPVIKKYIDETDPRYKSKKYYLDCFFLGHSYLMISDYKNAVKYFLIATGSKYPNKNIYKNLAFAFQGMGQSVEAAQAMEKAFELDTRDFIAADFLTHIYSELGDFENATFYSKIRSKLKY